MLRVNPSRFSAFVIAVAALTSCSAGEGNTDPHRTGTGGTTGGGGSSGGAGAQGGAGGSVSGTGGSSGSAGSGTGGSGGQGTGGTGGSAGNPDGGGGTGGSSGSGGMGGSGGSGNGTPVVYPPAAGAGDVNAGLAQLNAYRATLGENAVTLDAVSSTGCQGHIAYLISESMIQGTTVLTHDEPDHGNLTTPPRMRRPARKRTLLGAPIKTSAKPSTSGSTVSIIGIRSSIQGS